MTTSSGFMKVLGATWQIVLPLIRRAKPRNNRVFPTSGVILNVTIERGERLAPARLITIGRACAASARTASA
jgi:hypothetical protein